MSKNSNCESDDDDKDNDNNDKNNDDDADNNNDDADNKILRRGYCVKKHTRYGTRIHCGGDRTGHSEQSGDIWIRKKNTPTISIVVHHLVHF